MLYTKTQSGNGEFSRLNKWCQLEHEIQISINNMGVETAWHIEAAHKKRITRGQINATCKYVGKDHVIALTRVLACVMAVRTEAYVAPRLFHIASQASSTPSCHALICNLSLGINEYETPLTTRGTGKEMLKKSYSYAKL